MRSVKWLSTSGEFAFLSVGGTAQGVIAIGGVAAHGLVAIGGVASAGVISIGMNAVGSFFALGMNTAAPISLSLINGLGIYSAAGVNGWGAWTDAGTNSTGMSSHGGVNSDFSVLPAIVVIAILLIVSSVARGKREPRAQPGTLPLRRFMRSPKLDAGEVRARLVATHDEAIELADGNLRVSVAGSEPMLSHARALGIRSKIVIAHLVRVEEVVPDGREVGYRESPGETTRVTVRCLDLAPAPAPESWLPKDADEVQWVIAWSARVAAVVAIALLVWLRPR